MAATSRAIHSAPRSCCPECVARSAAGESLTEDARLAAFVELPIGATEDRVLGSLDLERALATRRAALRAGSPGPRQPRPAVRRRGQSAARSPGGCAAGRRGDGHQHGRARRHVVQSFGVLCAGRHDEPRGRRIAAAAARPLRARRRRGRHARSSRAGRGGSTSHRLRDRPGRLRRALERCRGRRARTHRYALGRCSRA